MKASAANFVRKERIFVDTNVILDFFLEREPFYYDALKIWAAAPRPCRTRRWFAVD